MIVCRFVAEHPFAWRMLFREPPSDPEVAVAHARLERHATRAIAAFLSANADGASGEGVDATHALEMFAELLKAAQNGLAVWWYEHPEVPREQVVARVLDFCWDGLERVAARAGEPSA